MKRISKSLSFGGAANQVNSSSNDTSPGTLAAGTSDSNNVTGMGALRRQATKELLSEEESGSKRKVTSRSSVSSVMTSSIVKVMSRLSVSSQGNLRQVSKRSAKAPSRLVQEDDAGTLLIKTQSKSPSRSVSKQLSKKQQHSLAKTSSKTDSIQKSPSRQGSLSKIPSKQGSLTKTPSKRNILSKTSSLSRSGSKGSMKQRASVKTLPAKKTKPRGKQLWFPAGSYLTVRNEEGML